MKRVHEIQVDYVTVRTCDHSKFENGSRVTGVVSVSVSGHSSFLTESEVHELREALLEVLVQRPAE